MPTHKDNLTDRLSRASEIQLSVTGRKSGKTITNPVWFVAEDGKLYLLPVSGADSQWYRNVLKNPQVRIHVGGAEAGLRLQPLTESSAVKSVVEKFRQKYGASDVKKYYSELNVAVVGELR